MVTMQNVPLGKENSKSDAGGAGDLLSLGEAGLHLITDKLHENTYALQDWFFFQQTMISASAITDLYFLRKSSVLYG